MKIEISKKAIVRLALALICIIVGVVVGYNYGYHAGVSITSCNYEAKISALEKPMGDGSHFYRESRPEVLNGASTLIIYHSTPQCKDIKYGIEMDVYGGVYKRNDKERYPYYCCPKCMDADLIEKLKEKQDFEYSQMGI